MAIAPFNIQPQQAYSEFDFSPLGNLGQQMQRQQQLSDLAKIYGGMQQTPGAGATTGSVGPATDSSVWSTGSGTNYQNAISGIESGGRYNLLGPITGSGDRAYGKYQVMGNNIADWTRQTFGKSMTPQEFLANPSAQDAVFNKIFGGYVNKYGPTGAAKAWFAGEGGMNNPNARDILGTTVDSYARRFNAGLGGQ